jgi:predicted metal-dependent hydrolase
MISIAFSYETADLPCPRVAEAASIPRTFVPDRAAVPYRCDMTSLKYLSGYNESTLARVRALIEQDRLGSVLRERYGEAHAVRSDKALFRYAVELKDRYLRKTDPLDKVVYDNKLQVVRDALGTHTTISRVQGTKLKASREIRIATLFRDAPARFLEMIVVHELAHLKEREHNKAFYQLCAHMAPDYHQLEFDVRLYLTHLDCMRAATATGVQTQPGTPPPTSPD